MRSQSCRTKDDGALVSDPSNWQILTVQMGTELFLADLEGVLGQRESSMLKHWGS